MVSVEWFALCICVRLEQKWKRKYMYMLYTATLVIIIHKISRNDYYNNDNPWFLPETENFDSDKKEYHVKAYLKGSRMAQILAS